MKHTIRKNIFCINKVAERVFSFQFLSENELQMHDFETGINHAFEIHEDYGAPTILSTRINEHFILYYKGKIRYYSLAKKTEQSSITAGIIYGTDHFYICQTNAGANRDFVNFSVYAHSENQNDLVLSVENHPRSVFYISGTLLFTRFNDGISCFDLYERKKLWTRPFSELNSSDDARSVGDLIFHKNTFFIFITDSNNNAAVFCISAQTGETIHKTEPFGGKLVLHNNHIYVANPYNVRMLNVNTYEVTTIELNDLLEPHGWSMMWNRFVVQGNKFYFVHQQAGGGDEAIVGIIDLTKKELLWHTAIPIEEGSYWVDEIQVYENKLFVLTQGGTLHIFEQE